MLKTLTRYLAKHYIKKERVYLYKFWGGYFGTLMEDAKDFELQ